jgi:trehalose 6-phosphate phosphatase
VDRRDATIDRLARDPANTVLLFDFDGSLAHIVDRPDEAVALPQAAPVLGRLAGVFGRVGVVSGRPVEFLVQQLPVAGLTLAGLYGLELMQDRARELDPRVAEWVPVIATAADEADARLPGVLVERKAGVSVTLHWRTVPDRESEIRSVGADLAAKYGLDAPLRGRRALELRPPVPVDKGTAVEALVRGYAHASFAGDDAGDLPAFDALDRLAARGALQTALRVGVRSDEAPAAILERADLVVDGPDDLLDLLAELATRVGR